MDEIILLLSADQYRPDGDPYDAIALITGPGLLAPVEVAIVADRALNQCQPVRIVGELAGTRLTITFTNDAFGGAGKDRNLWFHGSVMNDGPFDPPPLYPMNYMGRTGDQVLLELEAAPVIPFVAAAGFTPSPNGFVTLYATPPIVDAAGHVYRIDSARKIVVDGEVVEKSERIMSLQLVNEQVQATDATGHVHLQRPDGSEPTYLRLASTLPLLHHQP